MGAWENGRMGVWARRGTERRRRDLGAGQGEVVALRLGQREAGSKGSRLVSGWRAGRWSAVVLAVAPISQSVKRCGTS